MVPERPWSIAYADGAANAYHLDATADGVRFVYDPITPAESSTGTYRGGDPVDARLAPDDPRLAALWAQLEHLAADTAHHVADRRKGDGAVTLTTPAGTRRFLAARAATREVEASLAQLRGHHSMR